MHDEFTNKGSRNNLVGEDGSADLVKIYSNEEQVSELTPPTFIILSDNDKVVVPRNSIEFYMALKKYNIPAALYIVPKGGHGWGTRADKPLFPVWTSLLQNWLKNQKLIN